MSIRQLNVSEAKELLKDESVCFIDIRNSVSFDLGHPERAINLDFTSFQSFFNNFDKRKSILIICYHGISSIDVGEMLYDDGFENVYSLKGGYEAWKNEGV